MFERVPEPTNWSLSGNAITWISSFILTGLSDLSGTRVTKILRQALRMAVVPEGNPIGQIITHFH